MNDVNKTLYIPLYGKALVSKKGIILHDKKAEEIWEKVKFPLKVKSKSKWLAYYMGMRSAVFDRWVLEKISKNPNAIVLHLGCGLDGRYDRLNVTDTPWIDIDLPAVILEREKYYTPTKNYSMLTANIAEQSFIQRLPNATTAIVVIEGLSMYVSNEQLCKTLACLSGKFEKLCLLVDCYTPFAVKMSKIKNPVKEVGVSKVYGVASPSVLEKGANLKFIEEKEITPINLINELKGIERFVFKNLYAGKTSRKLYKLYEYEK